MNNIYQSYRQRIEFARSSQALEYIKERVKGSLSVTNLTQEQGERLLAKIRFKQHEMQYQ